MANSDRPSGAKPVRHVGSPWMGAVNKYHVHNDEGTAIGIGDLVTLVGSADAAGIRDVRASTANQASIGVVVGVVKRTPESLDTPQYVAATPGANTYVLVVDDPNAYFEMQEDGTAGVAAVGLNCSMVTAAPSTVTGTSVYEIDSSEVTTDATDVLKLIEVVQREDNDGTIANAKWIVKINNHQLGSHTGTAGV